MAFMGKLKLALFSLSFLFIHINTAQGTIPMSERSWFTNTNCNSLEIKRHKSVSNHKVISEVAISDSKILKKIIDRIQKIPTDGDMMVSFGPDAEYIELIFACEGKKQTIEVYQRGFKTPSTGFNSNKGEVEASLYEDIATLLAPAVNKKILKIENLELKFENFSITYKGSEFKDGAPATVSFTTETYLVKDKSGTEQTIRVTSGQTTPKVQKFEVNKKTYSLLPFNSSKGVSLYPEYFEITH